ncbi:hypothetical protein AK812_SmicGene17692 [Symbiodinium microadriaticum]|uniref:Uncharacterized protein n=1 Tax=Symbiodinium microadriaticum TaxID=2951 RepID=A0A1Q9DX26_SYMMI|nr:hypothetical protein AK812_SmicGene17692 [Symbiodinium microadriaticum]CAE7656733.1 unnamed protein product [Symbiodinium microadriaticum]
MDSAGSGMEPNYDNESLREDAGDHRLPELSSNTAAEESGSMIQGASVEPETGHTAGQSLEERAAAEILAGAEDLEPEYDFESAEGGVPSPGRDDLRQGEGIRVDLIKGVMKAWLSGQVDVLDMGAVMLRR